MSMYIIEDFAEAAVDLIAASKLDAGAKRNAIAKIYQLEDMLDTSFTRFRNIEQLLECSFAVSFPKKDVPDALKKEMSFDMTRKVGPDDYKNFPHLTYVESGTPLWQGLKDAGKITGLAAEPLQPITGEEIFMLLYSLGGPLKGSDRDAGIITLVASGSFESFDKDNFEKIFGISKKEVEEELE